MIIGISGKAGGGKNTLCSAIQFARFAERYGQSNSDFPKYLADKEAMKRVQSESGYIQKAFATKLKQMASLILGVPVEKFEDQEFKASYLPKEWNQFLKGFTWESGGDNGFSIPDEELKMTVREFLINLGLKCREIHPEFWVNGLFADYKPIFQTIDKSTSCGDRRVNHGYNKTRIFHIYHNIKQRCINPNHPRYEFYGGKGVIMCDEWMNSLETFVKWSEQNGYTETLTIDRVDNDGNYCPENCWWTTYKIQSINQGLRKDNTSGYKGVSRDKSAWRADIQVDGKKKFLGYFSTPELASEAYEFAFIERQELYEGREDKLIYPNIIITDVRFENEAKVIKDRGGIMIRINRPDNPHPVIDSISETELDKYPFDVVIENTSLEGLVESAKLILNKI